MTTSSRPAPENALHITVSWGDAVVHTAYASPPAPFALGAVKSDGSGCALPPALLDGVWPLVEVDAEGRVALALPPGARAWVSAAGVAAPRTEIVGAVASGVPARLTLAPGCEAEVRLAQFCVRITHGKKAERCRDALPKPGRGLLSTALSGVAHAGILAALAVFMPPTSAVADDDITDDQRITIRHYLDSVAERENEAAREARDGMTDGTERPAGDATGTRDRLGRATREATLCGSVPCGLPTTNHSAPVAETAHRPGAFVPGDANEPRTREQMLDAARTNSMIELVNRESAAPDFDWTRADVASPYPFAPSDDAWHVGDLTLTDPVGPRGPYLLDHVRTLSDDDALLRRTRCRGNDCFGGPLAKRVHDARGPELHDQAPPDAGGGGLPQELIQRAVHTSFGRFRACYQAGLRNNPSLAGRVMVRFLIGRDGRVVSAADGGSDLPDRAVVACITAAFQGLTFAPPERGTVTVSYPLVLNPE